MVVGGGPAGATMGWALAKRGVRVAILERTEFPREKVCGDFVEPRGLKLLSAIGCLPRLERSARLPITHVAMFLEGRSAYRGKIPFYGSTPELPPHGYIVPRDELDTELLASAGRAGAAVLENCAASSVERRGGLMTISARHQGQPVTFLARLVVGADGAHSIVARSAGLLREDPRYVAVSQRAYVDGVSVETGEAAFFFDRDLFPGYGWMFPMLDGRANVGVGILAETRDRYRISVPALFQRFLEKLKRLHPGCGAMRLASKPIGGIVKTYGGGGPNHFAGGILIGDAGCFVDPMTGEGITPAAESALLGAAVIADALDQGRTDAAFLSAYERSFRAYFDPAMCYLDFVACMMRNRHFCEFWLRVVARGCELAMRDSAFAGAGGAAFGGLDIRPLDMVGRMWVKTTGLLVTDAGRLAAAVMTGQWSAVTGIGDVGSWYSGWWGSLAEDPAWHARWLADIGRKWLRLPRTIRLRDPRVRGPAHLGLKAGVRSG